ncbi:hypothetical protein [Bryobacter aggregatus]|uniref:hypothetical protein n=1 Tax=Bryobacter aggregatus TaxID=360054 RepID=UPI0004E1D0D9|nr:hypothetical protein [Bryobacter aggregatus]
MMKRFLIAIAIFTLFLIANRAAFEGYFSGDDLDNLSWATVPSADRFPFSKQLLTPTFSESNQRPTGAMFYRIAGLRFGLDFSRYIPILFAIHLCNAAMLAWIVWRKTGQELATWAITVFFLFHTALLEAFWKPMYIFDLLCASFCLITWLLFSTRYWPLALASFWLAYKSKEVALFFPVVLALDHWRRAIPFFLISANFGLQALRANAGRDNAYTLRFNLSSLRTTLPFYAQQAAISRYGAILLAPLLYFVREWQILKYFAGTLALLIPLLFLPARLFSVYLYVPLIPACVGLAFVFSRVPRSALATGLLLWCGLNYGALREKRKTELSIAQESRAWVEQLQKAHEEAPIEPPAFYENVPPGLQLYGMQGALRLITQRPMAEILNSELESARLLAQDRELPTLSWFQPTNRLTIQPHHFAEAKRSYLEFQVPSSSWQLKSGWYEQENGFRWTAPTATLMLAAPPGATAL